MYKWFVHEKEQQKNVERQIRLYLSFSVTLARRELKWKARLKEKHSSSIAYIALHFDMRIKTRFRKKDSLFLTITVPLCVLCEWMGASMHGCSFDIFIVCISSTLMLTIKMKTRKNSNNNNTKHHQQRSNWSYVILLGAFEWIKNHQEFIGGHFWWSSSLLSLSPSPSTLVAFW